ncbi:MAG: hypothetical protein K2X43_11375 [Hyphomonadaceae bacterium]|jgi:uncharacterized protein YoxC|nr:hypothetical protein [Hyphomonadaceae bacterium]
MRNHILIAGTGRAGTSLLVRILDACGLETELSRRGDAVFWDEHANAGIENIPILGEDHPYVVKSPFSYQFMRELLARADIGLDGVLIPVRDLDEAAASRIILELRHRYEHQTQFASQAEDTWRDWGTVPGGVTYSLEPLDQARILAHSLHRIIEALVEREIPIHFLKFPKLAQDIAYLHRRLAAVLPSNMPFAEFAQRVTPLIDAEKVRTTGELSAVQRPDSPVAAVTARPAHDAVALTPFEALDHIALKRELKSVAGTLARTTAERNDLAAQRDALAAERDNLIAQRGAIVADRNNLLSRLNSLATERAHLEAKLANLTAEGKQALARFDHVISSTSWKVTQPMRSVVGRIRNLKSATRRPEQR